MSRKEKIKKVLHKFGKDKVNLCSESGREIVATEILEEIKDPAKVIIKKAKEAAKEEFVELLKEEDKMDQYVTKRQELMMSCTHPESHRVYPDHSKGGAYDEDMIWHCVACGYAEFREGEDE